MPATPNYPKIAQLKDVAALRERLAELGLDLPVDDHILSAAEGSPLAAPLTIGGFEVGNRWCIHPMEGWDANRDGSPSRAHAAPLAKLWPQRREADLGRRSGGGAARRPRESQSNAGHRIQSRGLTALLDELHRRPPRSVRHARRPARRPATHPLRPLLQAGRSSPRWRRGSPTIIRCSSQSSASIRDDDSIVWTDADLERLIDDYVAAARPRARRRLSVRRREGLPRLLAARVSQRPPPPRQVRRRPRRPLARAAHDHRPHPQGAPAT